MFPTIAAINAVKGNSARLLFINIGVLLFFAAGAVMVLTLFGEPLLRGLYGDAYAPGAGLLGLYGLSVLLALPVNSINFYLMARSRTTFVPLYITGVCLQIGLIVAFHSSLRQVILAMCASNSAMLLSYTLLLGIPRLHARLRPPYQSTAMAGNASSNGEEQQ
jgi:O-antigen/teichoic acid export membrane protein